jgi:hypothetical protein
MATQHLYVINIRVYIPKQRANFVFSDYEVPKGGDPLNDAIEQKINNIFNSTGEQAEILTPYDYTDFGDGEFRINLIFDYDKLWADKYLTSTGTNPHLIDVVDQIKRAITDTIQGATTTKSGAPNPPLFEFLENESNAGANTFTGSQNFGGWKMVVMISQPRPWPSEAPPPPATSPTQSAPPTAATQSGPEVPTEETPTSPPADEAPTDTPDQETPPPDPSTTSPPDEQPPQDPNQAEQTTPTQTDEQEQSREERTGENPNENETKAEDVEKTKGIKNVFPNEKKPKDISFKLPPDEAYQKEFVESFGNLPFLWYNAYQIEYNHIMSLELSYIHNIPNMTVKFRDSLGKMKDQGIPLDDSRIALFLNPRTKLLKPIHLDFKIIDFQENNNIYEIEAVLDVKELYLKKFKSYSQVTSFELFKQIAKELGLGYNSNIDDTDDKMTWINTGNKLFQFLNECVKYTYKSDETFLFHYIDFYYHLNYVDLEKELKRDLEKELGVANTGMEEALKSSKPEVVQKNFLTNDFASKNSNYFFDNFTIINNATKTALKKGYLTKVKFYDELEKTFLQFDVDALTGEADKKILMRGAPQDDVFFKENVNFVYKGKIDTDNMHKNFYYAHTQNQINLTEIQKLSLILELPTPNYNFYKFQKVYVVLSNQSANIARSDFNSRLSGQWMIVDIAFTFASQKLRQRIELVKRDLELSPDELKNEGQDNNKQQPNQGQGEKNENPTDQEPQSPTPPPDSPGPTASQPEPPGATQSAETPPVPEPTPEPPVEENFPLTKEMWRSIYQGKINPKVIEKYYTPMITVLKKNNITDAEQIAQVLAYINIESNFLLFVEEDINWHKYYQNL